MARTKCNLLLYKGHLRLLLRILFHSTFDPGVWRTLSNKSLEFIGERWMYAKAFPTSWFKRFLTGLLNQTPQVPQVPAVLTSRQAFPCRFH